jgi:hypothetical protein
VVHQACKPGEPPRRVVNVVNLDLSDLPRQGGWQSLVTGIDVQVEETGVDHDPVGGTAYVCMAAWRGALATMNATRFQDAESRRD